MYKCSEIDTHTFELIARDRMQYPRHGHHVCALGDKFLVVTGSRKETENAQIKCEQYNSDLDMWFDIPNLNEGRHYHASCSFKDRFVYVFCGILNSTKRYCNSIEKYDSTIRGPWELI
jgi:hypothetical protein